MTDKKPPDWLEATVARLRLIKSADEDERKRCFYEALLDIPWLPTTVRRVILKELGSSLRIEKREWQKSKAELLRACIDAEKERIRKRGIRPRGGIYDAAVADVAHSAGMSIEAVKKFIQRYK